MADRDRFLVVRTSAEERAMLQALAEKTGVSGSDIVRQYVRRAYAASFPPMEVCVALVEGGRRCGEQAMHMDRRRLGPVCTEHLEAAPLESEGVRRPARKGAK